MGLPKSIDLYFVPAQVPVPAEIVDLTRAMIERRMGPAWWNDPAVDRSLAEREIDRHWDWNKLQIERPHGVIGSGKLAVVTEDGAVQGAAMCSTEAVECTIDAAGPALFVELLFTAPRNRPWVRTDQTEQFRGVGLELLIAMAEQSQEMGFAGRLKLESSPGFVAWYAKRGLQTTSEKPILHEGVTYTPMELTAGAATVLLTEP